MARNLWIRVICTLKCPDADVPKVYLGLGLGHPCPARASNWPGSHAPTGCRLSDSETEVFINDFSSRPFFLFPFPFFSSTSSQSLHLQTTTTFSYFLFFSFCFFPCVSLVSFLSNHLRWIDSGCFTPPFALFAFLHSRKRSHGCSDLIWLLFPLILFSSLFCLDTNLLVSFICKRITLASHGHHDAASTLTPNTKHLSSNVNAQNQDINHNLTSCLHPQR